jgi:hypothetical protein
MSAQFIRILAVDKEKKGICQLGVSGLTNKAQIDGINTALSPFDITTQIYSEYGLSDNLKAFTVFNS